MRITSAHGVRWIAAEGTRALSSAQTVIWRVRFALMAEAVRDPVPGAYEAVKPAIQGEKLRLRPLTDEDMAARAWWACDADLARLMGVPADEGPRTVSHVQEEERNREWLAGRHACGARPYAVEAEGRYIGDIDFGVHPAERKADLTVFLGDRAAWGKGYGTEAVESVLAELFSDERIEFVEVDVAPGNERALRFWRKLAFSETCTDERGTRYLRRYRAPREG